MPISTNTALAKSIPTTVVGPVAIGASLGWPDGPAVVLSHAAAFPVIVVGVAALMIPALYIGAAFLGVAPRAGAVARSSGAALKDMGIVFLGLAPPLLFLIAAATEGHTVRVLGHLVVGIGVVLGLRALFIRLFDRRSIRALALFAGWSVVCFGIGAQLFTRAIPL